MPWTRCPLVLLLGPLSAFAPLTIDIYLPALPQLAHEFDASGTQIQLTLTACLAGLALGQIVVGPLSDAWGRRRPLLTGLALHAGTSILCALTTSPCELLALRFLQGTAAAAGIVIARAIVADLQQGAAAAHLLSKLMVATGLGPVFAPVLGGQLLRVMDWRDVLGVLAAIVTVLLGMVAIALPETLPRERRRPSSARQTVRAFSSLLRNPGFISHTMVGALSFAAMFAYVSQSPYLFQREYSLTPQQFSLLFAINGLGIALAGRINATLLRHHSPSQLLHIGLMTSIVGSTWLLAVVAAGWGLSAVAIPLFVAVSSFGLVAPNACALALAAHGESAGAGSASALIGLLQYALGALVAPLAAFGGRASLSMASTVTALSLAAAVAALAAERASRQSARIPRMGPLTSSHARNGTRESGQRGAN